MLYKIEFIPRYGTSVGIISTVDELTDSTRTEEPIGHIRLSDPEEQKRWERIINQLNQEWKSEIKKHPPQELEQDIY